MKNSNPRSHYLFYFRTWLGKHLVEYPLDAFPGRDRTVESLTSFFNDGNLDRKREQKFKEWMKNNDNK